MIIYQNQKSGFLHDVQCRDIEEVIHEAFRAKIGHKVSKEEVRSWANSLAYMGKVLVDDDIPDDCGVAIEYNIPQTAKRVDFLLTGKTADQKDCLVIRRASFVNESGDQEGSTVWMACFQSSSISMVKLI